MTFTISYRREVATPTLPTFINEKEIARYVLNYTDSGNNNRRAVYLCGQDSREDELKSLLDFSVTDISECFGVPKSKVKCVYGDGVIVATIEEPK